MHKTHHFGVDPRNPCAVFLVQILQHDFSDRRDVFFMFTQRRNHDLKYAQSLISEEWGETDTGRQAKYYTLTAAGRAHLRAESARWTAFSRAVARALAVASA